MQEGRLPTGGRPSANLPGALRRRTCPGFFP